MAVPMMKIYAAGLLFHYVLINSNGILRSTQRIKVSLKTMALVCGINIGLNLFFLFQTTLGFKGIALATASSVMIGCLINLARVKKEMEGERFLALSHQKDGPYWLADRSSPGPVATLCHGPFSHPQLSSKK